MWLINLISSVYSTSYFCGIRLLTLLCACCCNPVLSQHTLYGSQTYDSDAIGRSQGGAVEAGPALRRQVQNLAAHDTVGYSLSYIEIYKSTPPGIFPGGV